MASADLRNELLCSICLSTFTEPVTLRCGHSFCRVCIDQVLNTQEESGVYSCPECRTKSRHRPAPRKNITLCNVVKNFLSTQPREGEVIGICCTYCVDSPVPAVKSCLHCEASLCDKHLKVHNKSEEHVLIKPSNSLEKMKCSIHKKILEYYCPKDDAYICVYCSAEEHQGHQVEKLDEPFEKKKKKLRHFLQKLIPKREVIKKRVQSLEERWRKSQEKSAGEAERVIALFLDIRRRLDNLEDSVLSEISRQEEEESLSLSDVIQKLENKKDELSRKISHIEELCNMTDPLTFLQEPDTGDLCDPEEEGGDEDTGGHDKTHDVDDLDVITGMLHKGFSDIITYLQNISATKPENKRKRYNWYRSPPSHTKTSPVSRTEYGGDGVIVRPGGAGEEVMDAGDEGVVGQGPADILLDVNTTYTNLLISDDRKTATWTLHTQYFPETAKRFLYYPQVMSIRRFFSGQHYWDVEIHGSGVWRVGMCYPSINRREDPLHIQNNKNNKFWGLCGEQWGNNQPYLVTHDKKEIQLPNGIYSRRFRTYLDYEAGQLSFYYLCDTIRHLHTFTTTFTEPLHVVLYVGGGSIKILRE
ncbi:E3 ubiquitin/ISG15 ligase TRIM25-like [Hyla sarda]|uniref:E3 ubiquitin/ISG15 ligase TRIM25-like n=1 Tax=Hyla sarda TaxID=327740 RepID=UPI0024C3FF54|nr:E3 ubiquitin/ISG15 ligase TRIM25-like [Hyla sarda]